MKTAVVLVVLIWASLCGLFLLARFAVSPANQGRFWAAYACMFAPEQRAEWQQALEKRVLIKDCYPVRLAEERQARRNQERLNYLLKETVKTQQELMDSSR
jgi:hypothetical protein